MTRRRVVDWALIVLLTGSFGVFFVRGIADGLRTQRGQLQIMVSSAATSDSYPVVTWEYERTSSFEPGDQLETVDGQDLRGSSALRFYDRAIRGARERGFANVRLSRDGTSFQTRLELVPAKWWWVPFPTFALSLLVGVLILLRAPDWHLARRNLVMIWCLSVSPILHYQFNGPSGLAFEEALSGVFRSFGAGLLVANAQDHAFAG